MVGKTHYQIDLDISITLILPPGCTYLGIISHGVGCLLELPPGVIDSRYSTGTPNYQYGQSTCDYDTASFTASFTTLTSVHHHSMITLYRGCMQIRSLSAVFLCTKVSNVYIRFVIRQTTTECTNSRAKNNIE